MKLGTNSKEKVERVAPANLQEAFKTAMAFPTNRAMTLQPPPQYLAEKANEETSFGRVIIDERGLTPGTRLHILEPARAVFAEWKEARRAFDVAIEPVIGDINAARNLEQEIKILAKRRDEQIAQAEEEFGQDHKYQQIRERFEKAEGRFKMIEQRHSNRSANMAATGVLYWVGLLFLGAAEWLINYQILLTFTGDVVAIAAGATIVMGLLLAFAAHGHGLILKQWSYRFGQDKEIRDRFSDWRLFALATFSLLIVLGSAGGSRYAVVMRQIASSAGPNLLGPDAVLEFNPIRDISLSLLWNIMAWAAGVFLSYFAHDKDPEFMDATAQWHRVSRSYHRFRKVIVDKLRTIEAQFAREKAACESAAASRSAAMGAERKLLEQVEAHESALVNAIAGVTRNAAQAYHSAMAQLAVSQRGGLTIENGSGASISPSEFRAMKVLIDAELIRGLV